VVSIGLDDQAAGFRVRSKARSLVERCFGFCGVD
jgi:hypothetical protein